MFDILLPLERSITGNITEINSNHFVQPTESQSSPTNIYFRNGHPHGANKRPVQIFSLPLEDFGTKALQTEWI